MGQIKSSNDSTSKSKWVEVITIGLVDRFADILAEKLSDEDIIQLTEDLTDETVQRIVEKIVAEALNETKGTVTKQPT